MLISLAALYILCVNLFQTPCIFDWYLAQLQWACLRSNASVVCLRRKRLIAQKPDAPVFYLMVIPVSWQMFTLASPFLSFLSAASQPPMLWLLIYILISRVQDWEACCKNTVQTVPADRKVRSEHGTDVLRRYWWGGEHKNIKFTDIYQTVYGFPGLWIVYFSQHLFTIESIKSEIIDSLKHLIADMMTE